MFDAGQCLFDQRDSIPADQQFAWRTIPQNRQRREQPVRRLVLVAEDSNRVSDHGNQQCD